MYISFPISEDHYVQSQGEILVIEQNVQYWAEKYHIRYMLKRVPGEMRLTLADESRYTVFSLTWNAADHQLIDCKDC